MKQNDMKEEQIYPGTKDLILYKAIELWGGKEHKRWYYIAAPHNQRMPRALDETDFWKENAEHYKEYDKLLHQHVTTKFNDPETAKKALAYVQKKWAHRLVVHAPAEIEI